MLPTDAYMIAINGCQLGWTPGTRGITQMPFGVETVFPVGPLHYAINRETRKFEGASISLRFSITIHNNAAIPTTPLLDPAYARVSAVLVAPLIGAMENLWLCTSFIIRFRWCRWCGLFGVDDDEWFAEPVQGDQGEFDLPRLVASPRNSLNTPCFPIVEQRRSRTPTGTAKV